MRARARVCVCVCACVRVCVLTRAFICMVVAGCCVRGCAFVLPSV